MQQCPKFTPSASSEHTAPEGVISACVQRGAAGLSVSGSRDYLLTSPVCINSVGEPLFELDNLESDAIVCVISVNVTCILMWSFIQVSLMKMCCFWCVGL